MDLDRLLDYHPPTDGQRDAMQAVRTKAKQFAEAIKEHCPDSPDRTAAIRKVREALMTANAAIILKGEGY